MKKIITIFTLLLAMSSIAQTNPENQLGTWYAYGGSHKLSEKVSLKSQAQFRFFKTASDLQQLMLRAGVNYKLNKTISATLGYAYFNTDATFGIDGGTSSEHRMVEDLNVAYAHSKFKIAHRFRLEHRFFSNDTRHWGRYQIGVSHPISNKISGYIYNEVFLNFSGDTYSQNWFGLGVKHALSNNVKLQLGYHHISLNQGNNFHRILVGVNISTNHFKKK